MAARARARPDLWQVVQGKTIEIIDDDVVLAPFWFNTTWSRSNRSAHTSRLNWMNRMMQYGSCQETDPTDHDDPDHPAPDPLIPGPGPDHPAPAPDYPIPGPDPDHPAPTSAPGPGPVSSVCTTQPSATPVPRGASACARVRSVTHDGHSMDLPRRCQGLSSCTPHPQQRSEICTSR